MAKRTDRTAEIDALATRAIVELDQIDPLRNRRRRYRLRECRTLFREDGLLVEWGRIGWPLRMRTELFASEHERLTRKRELVALRLQHGYRTRSRAY